jgi:hypothetical protein
LIWYRLRTKDQREPRLAVVTDAAEG